MNKVHKIEDRKNKKKSHGFASPKFVYQKYSELVEED